MKWATRNYHLVIPNQNKSSSTFKHYIILNKHQMGCLAMNGKQNKLHNESEQKKWMDTPVGKITIQVSQIYLEKLQDKSEKKQDLFLVFRLSNQEQRISFNKLNTENKKKVTFAVNSCYKFYGRYLSIQVWNAKSGNTIDIGLGLVNLHQAMEHEFLFQKQFTKVIKVGLNYKEKPAGFIHIQSTFTPFLYQTITFKVFGAMLRASLGKSFENSQCMTRITIGEEVLETKTIQSETNYLNWEGQEMRFRVPTFITEGKVHVIDRVGSSDIILGQMILDIPTLLDGTRQKQINECLDIDQVLTGKINLLYVKGDSSFYFPELDSPRKVGRNTRKRVMYEQIMNDEKSESQQSTMFSMEGSTTTMERTRRASLPPMDVKKALQKLMVKRKKVCEVN